MRLGRSRLVVVVVGVLEALLVDERLDEGEDQVADEGGDADLQPARLADEHLRLGQQVHDRGRDQHARRERHERMEPVVEPESGPPPARVEKNGSRAASGMGPIVPDPARPRGPALTAPDLSG